MLLSVSVSLFVCLVPANSIMRKILKPFLARDITRLRAYTETQRLLTLTLTRPAILVSIIIIIIFVYLWRTSMRFYTTYEWWNFCLRGVCYDQVIAMNACVFTNCNSVMQVYSNCWYNVLKNFIAMWACWLTRLNVSQLCVFNFSILILYFVSLSMSTWLLYHLYVVVHLFIHLLQEMVNKLNITWCSFIYARVQGRCTVN